MVVAIDTCSLLALTKYYLPLDSEHHVFQLIQSEFESQGLIVLDAIFMESQYIAQGIILKEFPFLEKNKTLIKSTIEMLPPSTRKFSNQIDNNFSIAPLKKKLSDSAYVLEKEKFMDSGDVKLLIYALNYIKPNTLSFDNPFSIITEESRTNNDGKLFKKLPSICDDLHINTITIPDYLKQNGVIVRREVSN